MPGLPQSVAFDLCGLQIGKPKRRSSARPQSVAEMARRRERIDHLALVVEGEIIPRLMLAHEAQPRYSRSDDQDQRLSEETVEKFALLSLAAAPENLLAVVGGLLAGGVTMEEIYLDLLGPSARLLGDFWLEDRISFADVTIALGKLHQLVRDLSLHLPSPSAGARIERSALFSPAPDEQHTFGLAIVEEFFRRAGWRTWSEPSGRIESVAAAASAHDFDVFCVSVCVEGKLGDLKRMIKRVRRVSRNHDVVVVAGGRLLVDQPELVSYIGADRTALDGREAVVQAEAAVARLARS